MGLLRGRVGAAKIGKCFHTGNMGFPLGEEVKDEDWLKREAEIWMHGTHAFRVRHVSKCSIG
jgi:hypothetical protein